jgi:hypothetical protein
LVNSVISAKTFKTTKVFEEKYPESIVINFDLATLNKSLSVSKAILKKYLGINDNRFFELAKNIPSKPEFYSAFISYSFTDKQLVNKIHDYLNLKNIKCFLWEKDAPGGKFLKQIMDSEIKKHDKIIFVSSTHSLKSEACQFELTQGRLKQNLNWSEVFIPIYIDNYLFNVEEFEIRPAKNASEYWENIIELRKINCIDATKLNMPRQKNKIFSEILQALTKE